MEQLYSVRLTPELNVLATEMSNAIRAHCSWMNQHGAKLDCVARIH